MNELLNKAINQLTDEEKNQLSDKQTKALQLLLGFKPSVPFSRATLYDCERANGLALDLRFIEPCVLPAPTLRIPQEIVHPVPSDFLCEHLLTVQKLFAMNNEKSCRMLIDAILIEVLKSEFNNNFYGFCGVKNDWEGTGFGYTGDVDYMIGSSRNKYVDNMDSSLLIVATKDLFSDHAIPHVLAEAGCLLKKRLAAGKETPVFAVVTNGTDFRFFAIDTDGVVYSSGQPFIFLKYGPDGDYTNSPTLPEILRWFTWFMVAIKSFSPSASSQDLAAEKIEDSLTQLRSCFGPKYPISSKKLKIQK